jgi:hypothetical protein
MLNVRPTPQREVASTRAAFLSRVRGWSGPQR